MTAPVPRIAGGVIADKDDFEFIAFVYGQVLGTGSSCTGSLIGPNVVLTAGHCVYTSSGSMYMTSQMNVAFTHTKPTTMSDFTGPAVKEIIVNPNFNRSTLSNDLALIILESDIPSDIATPVKIYTGAITTSTPLTAAGFGITNPSDSSSVSPNLMKVDLVAGTTNYCKSIWSSFDPSKLICTNGAAGKDTCSGDSGGPLATRINNGNDIVLAGITSFAPVTTNNPDGLCAQAGSTGYYTTTIAQEPRVAGGVIAGKNDFKFIAFVHGQASDTDGSSCAGSLIGPNVVLTAGHCVYTPSGSMCMTSQMDVAFTHTKSATMSDFNGPAVKEIIVNPNFDRSTLSNDLALIILESNVPSKLATPVKIYTGTITASMSLIAAGFGSIDPKNSSSISSNLMEVDLVAGTSDHCKSIRNWFDPVKLICTNGAARKDTCSGDSGGPLATLTSSTPKTANNPSGLCAQAGSTGYYVRASHYIDWIVKQTNFDVESISVANKTNSDDDDGDVGGNLDSDSDIYYAQTNFDSGSSSGASALAKQIKDIKNFLEVTRRKDATNVRVKKNGSVVKFKVRCSRYLYTLVVADAQKAGKLRQSLPPGLQVNDVSAKKKK
ncbi:hypothetical protein IW138_002504 [Coemansia sp. RSA 986]|nr:hypothetical protein IW138_002504 [Coemansia sp. RSA 986]